MRVKLLAKKKLLQIYYLIDAIEAKREKFQNYIFNRCDMPSK